jgi:hypothetical protein
MPSLPSSFFPHNFISPIRHQFLLSSFPKSTTGTALVLHYLIAIKKNGEGILGIGNIHI